VDPRVAPLAAQLDVSATLFRRGLARLEEGDWLARPVPGGNPAAFLAAHVLEARAFLVGLLGGDPRHAWTDTLAAARTADDLGSRPTATEIAQAFDVVTGRLARCLADAGPEALAADAGRELPGGDRTVLGAVAFFSFHESYHVGQLAQLLRALGRGSLTAG
jgi:uncharacterized damage-inducible protein DinB